MSSQIRRTRPTPFSTNAPFTKPTDLSGSLQNYDYEGTDEMPLIDEPADVSFFDLLPSELVLDIAAKLHLSARLKLAFACRRLYFLLIPYVVKDAVGPPGRWSYRWGGFIDPKNAKDCLGADKFSLLKALYIHICNADDLRTLSGVSFPKPHSLAIHLDTEDAEIPGLQDLELRFSGLKNLVFRGEPTATVLAAIAEGSPLLCNTTIECGTLKDHVEKWKAVPDSFLRTVKRVNTISGEVLLAFVGRSSFCPVVIDQDEWCDEITWPQGEDAVTIWKGLIQIDSLERIVECYGYLPSELLLLGLPPNLRELGVIQASGIPSSSFSKLREIIASHKCGLSIEVEGNWPDEISFPDLPKDERAFIEELQFWATVDEASFVNCGPFGCADKMNVVRQLARQIDHV